MTQSCDECGEEQVMKRYPVEAEEVGYLCTKCQLAWLIKVGTLDEEEVDEGSYNEEILERDEDK